MPAAFEVMSHKAILIRYDIDMREIGIGGYGKVFLAKDRMFKDRQVAIKKALEIETVASKKHRW